MNLSTGRLGPHSGRTVSHRHDGDAARVFHVEPVVRLADRLVSIAASMGDLLR